MNAQAARAPRIGDIEVSPIGLGCMGMSMFYGPADWDESIGTIRRAIDEGVTLLDTADVYGDGHNETLVGQAIKGRRDRVQLATKFGVDVTGGEQARTVRGEAAYVRRACDSSLRRLEVDVIDLLYLHGRPQTAPIEETVGAMADLVAAGKVRNIGLSEVDDELLRRAYAVHPIAAVQSEYSLWTRDPEARVAASLREFDVALVAFAPLGRGFFTGALDLGSLGPDDFRRRLPRLKGEAVKANGTIVDTIRQVARKHDATPGQVALAWVIGRRESLGVDVVPIPGTKRADHLVENAGAVRLVLDDDDRRLLDPLSDRVVGGRY